MKSKVKQVIFLAAVVVGTWYLLTPTGNPVADMEVLAAWLYQMIEADYRRL